MLSISLLLTILLYSSFLHKTRISKYNSSQRSKSLSANIIMVQPTQLSSFSLFLCQIATFNHYLFLN